MSEEPRKIAELIVDDEVIYDYKCYAPESIMIPAEWDDMPKEHQEIIKNEGGIGCEGGGTPGSWCGWCHYSQPHGYNVPKDKSNQQAVEE